ncbi:PKD domain-containing protein [Desulfonema magnum]|uniref:Cell adhesion related domain (CARDB)-containing protein n=1 Tax=Desulfonema magnum TaxID=45655 RepID=A0A975BFS2_9BACT|nr:PKD domain-containing protein [Desulfonema magnum]QTA84934.1 Cell adhesion related domain (CARDB)-containing protein [Desulfonema magnum]
MNDDGTIPQFEENSWDVHNSYRRNAMLNDRGCVDLTMSHLRTEIASDAVTVTGRLGNGGVFHVRPGTPVSFYDGKPGENGTSRLGTVLSGEQLEPGGYETVSFRWEDPPRGIHAVYVVADQDKEGRGKVSESNEDNNTAVIAFGFQNHAPVTDAGSEQTVTYGETVMPDGTGSYDADKDPLTYKWTLPHVPEGSTAAI